jgi:mRNA interferase ChpB
LVLSSKTFNQLGLAWVCPISQGEAAAARSYGTIVSLIGAGTDTQGAIHCHQLKALDWKVRRVRLKERAPGAIIDDVLARVDAIINGD